MIRNKKSVIVYSVLLAALAAACLLSIFSGAVHVPFGEMLQSNIIQLRLARIILGVVADRKSVV